MGAVGANRDNVLNTDAETSREVDTGFIAKTHAFPQLLPVSGDDIGRLMRGEADSVARSMDEVLAITLILDNGSRRAVDIFTSHAWPYAAKCRPMGAVYNVVDALRL